MRIVHSGGDSLVGQLIMIKLGLPLSSFAYALCEVRNSNLIIINFFGFFLIKLPMRPSDFDSRTVSVLLCILTHHY